MDIQQQTAEKHAIQSYCDQSITIQGVEYNTSTLITPSNIIENWPIRTIKDLSIEHFTEVLKTAIEVIVIGHSQMGRLPSTALIHALGIQRIGIECMSLGAACRTFNVLLSENRQVALGFIC